MHCETAGFLKGTLTGLTFIRRFLECSVHSRVGCTDVVCEPGLVSIVSITRVTCPAWGIIIFQFSQHSDKKKL